MKYLFILLILCGCSTTKQVKRLLIKDPATALRVFREHAPCITLPAKIRLDTAGMAAMQETNDSLNSVANFYKVLLENIEPETLVDTLTVTDSVKVLKLQANIVALKKALSLKNDECAKYYNLIKKFKPIHDTIPVLDMACDKMLKECGQEVTILTVDSAKKDKWFWIAMGLMAVIGVWTFIKIKSLIW